MQKILNHKWSWGIYNESRNSRTNGHAEKSVVEAWQPIGMLESFFVGGAKVKVCQTKMETWSCKYGFIC